MGARYYFFTDRALLAAQGGPDAFGPASPVGGNDLFHITDNHAFSTAAPAFAICDGLVCAQKDDTGTLTLILKPAEQPPFDFPAISYILYKGIDPTSLLNGDGDIDTSKINNPLIDAIKTAWELPDNGNGTTTPSRKCLGLHLNPADYPSDQHPERFADGAPLDTLFYDGDPAIQLPLVRGGWKLGNFSDIGGLEIVVERLGRRPKLTLARTRDNILYVASLDPDTVYKTDDAASFMHWHAKEACLDFIDPCALWGSFFTTTLRVWNGTSFDKITGGAIYETVLRGDFDDSNPTAGAFFNRNAVYVDIRNEHDKSFNYYKTNGDVILATFDSVGALAENPRAYITAGWPIFRTDQTMLPQGQAGATVTLRLAFPQGNYSRISFLGATSTRVGSRKTRTRQQQDFYLSDLTDLPEFAFDVPIYGSAPARSVSCCLFMTVFLHDKRPACDVEAALELFPWPAPQGIPYTAFEIPFEKPNAGAIKTFSAPCLLRIPFVSPLATSYRIGWMQAGAQGALMVTPAIFDSRDLKARLPPNSASYANAGLLDIVGEMIKPFSPLYRQADDGGAYIDFAAPESWTDYLPLADAARFMYFMSAQSLADIQDAIGQDSVAVTVAPLRTGEESTSIAMYVQGLRAEDGKMVAFSIPLDVGAVSNADHH